MTRAKMYTEMTVAKCIAATMAKVSKLDQAKSVYMSLGQKCLKGTREILSISDKGKYIYGKKSTCDQGKRVYLGLGESVYM